jgi:hypothetical protein
MPCAVKSRFKTGLQISLQRSITLTPISLLVKTDFHPSNRRSLLSEFELCMMMCGKVWGGVKVYVSVNKAFLLRKKDQQPLKIKIGRALTNFPILIFHTLCRECYFISHPFFHMQAELYFLPNNKCLIDF